MHVTTISSAVNSAVPLLALEKTISRQEIIREELQALCTHLLYIRSWWNAYGDLVRCIDRQAAREVEDHMIDGAMFARSIGRAANLDVRDEEIKSYAWGNLKQKIILAGGDER